jgi:hypothetical protein
MCTESHLRKPLPSVCTNHQLWLRSFAWCKQASAHITEKKHHTLLRKKARGRSLIFHGHARGFTFPKFFLFVCRPIRTLHLSCVLPLILNTPQPSNYLDTSPCTSLCHIPSAFPNLSLAPHRALATSLVPPLSSTATTPNHLHHQ